MKLDSKNKLKFILAFVGLLQIIVSLLSQLVILKQIGAGTLSDAYIAAQAVPSVITSIIIVASQSVWLPIFVRNNQDKPKWLKLQGSAQFLLLILISTITIILITLKEKWITFLFPGFTSSQLSLTTEMASLFLFSAALGCHSALYTTALRSINRYIISEILPLFTLILLLIGMYYFIPVFGIIAAAYLTVIRAILLALGLHFLAGNPRYRLDKLSDKKLIAKQFSLLFSGSSLFKTGPLIDRYWSSQAASGGLTIYNLSQTAIAALASIFDKAICVPNASLVSKAVFIQDFSKVKALYRSTLIEITFISLLIGLVIYFSHPLFVSLLLNLVGLDNQHATDMWLLCLLLIGYLQASAAGSVIVSSFYAMGDMKTPMAVGFLGFVTSVFLKSVLFIFYGLKGLAIGTSVYYLLNAAIMFVLLERKVNARLS